MYLHKNHVQLYPELKPKERIDKLMVEFLNPILEPKGFKFLKSTRVFKKKGDFFDFHIRVFNNHHNFGNRIVSFGLDFRIQSLKYRRWETEYYDLKKNLRTNFKSVDLVKNNLSKPVNVKGPIKLKGWDETYYSGGFFDLVEHDNKKLMENIVSNIENAGFNYFDNYTSLDSAINKLKEFPVANLERIVDFYILQNKWKEAFDFFESNKQWHEEHEKAEGGDPNSQYSTSRKVPFEMRKEKLNNWFKQNSNLI